MQAENELLQAIKAEAKLQEELARLKVGEYDQTDTVRSLRSRLEHVTRESERNCQRLQDREAKDQAHEREMRLLKHQCLPPAANLVEKDELVGPAQVQTLYKDMGIQAQALEDKSEGAAAQVQALEKQVSDLERENNTLRQMQSEFQEKEAKWQEQQSADQKADKVAAQEQQSRINDLEAQLAEATFGQTEPKADDASRCELQATIDGLSARLKGALDSTTLLEGRVEQAHKQLSDKDEEIHELSTKLQEKDSTIEILQLQAQLASNNAEAEFRALQKVKLFLRRVMFRRRLKKAMAGNLTKLVQNLKTHERVIEETISHEQRFLERMSKFREFGMVPLIPVLNELSRKNENKYALHAHQLKAYCNSLELMVQNRQRELSTLEDAVVRWDDPTVSKTRSFGLYLQAVADQHFLIEGVMNPAMNLYELVAVQLSKDAPEMKAKVYKDFAEQWPTHSFDTHFTEPFRSLVLISDEIASKSLAVTPTTNLNYSELEKAKGKLTFAKNQLAKTTDKFSEVVESVLKIEGSFDRSWVSGRSKLVHDAPIWTTEGFAFADIMQKEMKGNEGHWFGTHSRNAVPNRSKRMHLFVYNDRAILTSALHGGTYAFERMYAQELQTPSSFQVAGFGTHLAIRVNGNDVNEFLETISAEDQAMLLCELATDVILTMEAVSGFSEETRVAYLLAYCLSRGCEAIPAAYRKNLRFPDCPFEQEVCFESDTPEACQSLVGLLQQVLTLC